MSSKPQLSLVPAAALGREIIDVPATEPSPAELLYAQPAVADAISGMLAGFGGREGLLTELLISPDLPGPLLTLLTFSFDPRFAEESFGALCAKARITPGDVLLAFRDTLAAKATIQAMHESSKELVAMLKEIVRAGITHQEDCEECQGTKLIDAKPCPACRGRGTVTVRANREAQKMVLDLVGLTKKSPMQFVNNNVVQTNVQQTSAAVFTDSPATITAGLPQIQQALSTILFNREVVRPSPTPVNPVQDSSIEGSVTPGT